MKTAKPLRNILVILLIVIFGCNKSPMCTDSSKGTIKHYSLDGCDWIIELNDGNRLEPINLTDFSIELKDGEKIWLTYELSPNTMSICMLGKTAKINCLEER